MGEPLFHERIIEMVRTAALRVKSVELLTNGTLLTEEMSNSLLEAGLKTLWVSLDTLETQVADNETNGHSQTETVMQNISLFNKARNERYEAAKLGIAFVAMKSNVKYLAELPGFIALNRVDEVNVSNIYPSDSEAENEALYLRTVNLAM